MYSIYLILCGLFNNHISSSAYVVDNEDMEGSFKYCHMISLEGRKETKKSLMIFGERTEIQTCHLLIDSLNRQCLCKLLPLLHGTV